MDGGITESISQPGIKEDIYAARTPIRRQGFGGITNKKIYMINLDLRKITTTMVGITKIMINEDHKQ